MFRFRQNIEIRFRDLDALNHVNNAVYLSYLEHARLNYMIGLDLGYVKPNIILARCEIDYLRPVLFGETLEVLVRVARVGKKSFDFEFEVYANHEIAARAKSVNVWFDYDTNQSVLIPEAARLAFRTFELISPLE